MRAANECLGKLAATSGFYAGDPSSAPENCVRTQILQYTPCSDCLKFQIY